MFLNVVGNWTPRVSKLNALSIPQELNQSCPSSGAPQEKEDIGCPACLRKLVKTLTLVMIQITGTTQNRDSSPGPGGGISRSGKDVISYGRTSIRNRLEAESAYPFTEGTFVGDRLCGFESFGKNECL